MAAAEPTTDATASGSYLDRIVARTRLDVAEAKRTVPEADLRARIAAQPPPTSLADALARGAPLAVLAEFKKASPSKGDIAPELVAAEQALRYAAAGCNVVSVLTEPHWFKGSLADLAAVKRALVADGHWPRVAVLRKDFIVDAYQLLEARAHGADTALLIVAVLSPAELAALLAAARALGFEPLVEVNTADEMTTALAAGARAIGVNNRNLHTFAVDLQTTERLGAMIPPGAPVQLVSLSGVAAPADVAPALAGGAVGVLVGEALMRAAEPAELIAGMRAAGAAARGPAPPPPPPPLVKVCGLRTAAAATRALECGADLLGLICVPGSKRAVSAEEAREIVAAVKARARALGKREGAPVRPPPAGAAAGGAAAASESESSAAAAAAAAWFGAGRAALDAAVRDHGRALVVGVFQDQSVAEMNAFAAAAGLDLIQLHGDEPADVPAQLCVPCLRVLHVPTDADAHAVLARLGAHVGGPVGLLLDTQLAGARGGTGVAFDWALAAALAAAGVPSLVAGGLSAANVADAVRAAAPCWGVDASSGLETDGAKDDAKVAAYVAAAKALPA